MIYKCCEGKREYHHGWMFSYEPFAPIDTTEEWRDIKGYEGKYQVSNKGNVRTFQRDRSMLMKLKDNKKVIINKILAVGIQRPEEAFSFLNTLDFADMVSVGIASEREAEESFGVLNKIYVLSFSILKFNINL